MKKQKLCIIGGGNIGTALALGLTSYGGFQARDIIITDRREKQREHFISKGYLSPEENKEAVSNASHIFLAIPPQNFVQLKNDISSAIDTTQHVIISVITGLSCSSIEQALKTDRVIRIMPNIAAEQGESITCISHNTISDEILSPVKNTLEKLGPVLTIPEEKMDAATVVGACGIAFFLRAIRAASQGATQIGFHPDEALMIGTQVARGAASLLQEKTHPEEQIDRVTTPKGSTISGLNEMEHAGFSSAVIRGIATSFKKTQGLL